MTQPNATVTVPSNVTGGASGYYCTCGSWVPSGVTHICPAGRLTNVNSWRCWICGWVVLNTESHICPGPLQQNGFEERLTEIERILKRLEEKYLDGR